MCLGSVSPKGSSYRVFTLGQAGRVPCTAGLRHAPPVSWLAVLVWGTTQSELLLLLPAFFQLVWVTGQRYVQFYSQERQLHLQLQATTSCTVEPWETDAGCVFFPLVLSRAPSHLLGWLTSDDFRPNTKCRATGRATNSHSCPVTLPLPHS